MADDAPAPAGEGIWARTTAPQSAYTGRMVLIGLLVLAVGLAVVFGLPLVLG